MNKAITDGLVLMPLPFAAGLGVWSSHDGTPGSPHYGAGGGGVFLPADQDFGGCLEISKTQSVAHLRYMGETTILPGCYLRITARVKAVSGPLCNVRIAGFAGDHAGRAVSGVDVAGPTTALTTYDEVVAVSAIVGTGARIGVDMVWQGAAYGHFGIDLTGPNGGLVRVDDIIIEDVTSVFQRNMMAMVDVRDFGAIGDGTVDDSAAFEAADAAANGRILLVSAGLYHLSQSVTLSSRVHFEGTIKQAPDQHFIVQNNFDYATYVDAFGDEETAFKKAYQALDRVSGHKALDLCGRCISLTAPLDLQAADPSRSVIVARRVLRNGQFQPVAGPAWDTTTVTSAGTCASQNPQILTHVAHVANVRIGAHVSGAGVGREVYVTAKDVDAQTVTLSQPLHDPAGTQVFTFQRFAYLLDFSGYDEMSQMVVEDVDFQCAGVASAVMLAPQGAKFQVRDCIFSDPKDRGLTSIGRGCAGLVVARCDFVAKVPPEPDQSAIGFNTNAHDVKIRDNHVEMFNYFCILGGSGTLISGNHFVHSSERPAGAIIITRPDCHSIVTANSCDNTFVEWTNEHSAALAQQPLVSFGGLAICNNIFTASNLAGDFHFIVVKPYGPTDAIDGFSVVNNMFRATNALIDRVEHVDTTYADLDFPRMRAVTFAQNIFCGVRDKVCSHAQPTQTGIADPAPYLPFKGRALSKSASMPQV